MLVCVIASAAMVTTWAHAARAREQATVEVLSKAFVYTEQDFGGQIDCNVRASRFVESVQTELRTNHIEVVGPNKGEEVAFYVTANAIRVPTAALMGGCVGSVSLTVFKPIFVTLSRGQRAIPAKGTLCQKSGIVAPKDQQNPSEELLDLAARFTTECIVMIRENVTKSSGGPRVNPMHLPDAGKKGS